MGLTATRSRHGSGSEPRDGCQRRDGPYYYASNLYHAGRPIKRPSTAHTSNYSSQRGPDIRSGLGFNILQHSTLLR